MYGDVVAFGLQEKLNKMYQKKGFWFNFLSFFFFFSFALLMHNAYDAGSIFVFDFDFLL